MSTRYTYEAYRVGAYRFARCKECSQLGRVIRRENGQWMAMHINYPGVDDYAIGRTRDEAVDKLMSLVGEG